MLWISELFSWVIFLRFEPCWHIFLDHEIKDFIIDPREAAIAFVGEKSSVCTQISSFQRPSIAFCYKYWPNYMNEVTLECSLYYKTKNCMCTTANCSLFFGCFWWPESLCIFTYKFQFADLMKMHFLVSSFLSAICQITSWRVYQTDFLTAFPSWHICKWVSYLTKEIIGQKQMIILKIFF